MADRPLGIENMAVSPESSSSQHNLRDNEKDEADLRSAQSNPKVDAPKKKTTFKITSVTKSSQRGGSGDLTQDNDSQDDLDENIDSHTEDPSSEIYDTNSKATDIELTPEEEVKESEPKEKPARFKVVKVETKEPFRRGRWVCYDYLDAPEKAENKQEEINVNSGSSSAANSVHYVHGVDDPSKNPLQAGATGTMPTQPQPTAGDVSSLAKTQGEAFQPVQPALSSSQRSLTPVSQANLSFSNHVAMSSVPLPYPGQNVVPSQSAGQSLRSGSSVPHLPPSQPGQTNTSQSLPGNIPYPSGQPQQMSTQQGGTVVAQTVTVPGSVPTSQTLPPGAMQTGEYMNSLGHGQIGAMAGHPMPTPQQQAMFDMSSQQSAYNLNAGAIQNLHVQQNHRTSASSQQVQDGFGSEVDLQVSLSGSTSMGNLGPLRSEMDDSQNTLGVGLAPLEIAVGGITNSSTEDDITEEAGSNTVAIDNKIEQAMDLVKSHLMYAVREEVEVLKEQIKELMERMHKLEQENKVLRSEASPETLAKLPAPLPPLQNPLLQQFMTSLHNPSPSSSS